MQSSSPQTNTDQPSATRTAHILIADDEPLFLHTTRELLRNSGYICHLAADANQALELLARHRIDLVLADLNMPGNLSLELLKQGRTQFPDVPLIVITGMPTLPSAIESVRLGIADYLLKPVKMTSLLQSVQSALRQRDHQLAKAPRANMPTSGIIGRSKGMRDVMGLVRRVASKNINVLITGESGTGKEVVAREIHRQSQRHALQVIDCTAIPESLFESLLFGHSRGSFTGAHSDQDGLLTRCDHGTAFLDELGELPLSMQAKLLRVVQDGAFTPIGRHEAIKIDTRFISATNRSLEKEIESGGFRKDLFYRLAVVHLELPPLRERGDDVQLLAEHFLEQLRPNNPLVESLSQEVIDCFHNYNWPGNVRELRNVLERAVSLAQHSSVRLEDLPPTMITGDARQAVAAIEVPATPASSRIDFMAQVEREYLIRLLTTHRGNVSRCAQDAEMTRQGFHKLLDKHGISADQFRGKDR